MVEKSSYRLGRGVMDNSISCFSVDYAVLIFFKTSSIVLFNPIPHLLILHINFAVTCAIPNINDVRGFSVGVTIRVSVLKGVDKQSLRQKL